MACFRLSIGSRRAPLVQREYPKLPAAVKALGGFLSNGGQGVQDCTVATIDHYTTEDHQGVHREIVVLNLNGVYA